MSHDRFAVIKRNKQWTAQDLNLIDSDFHPDLSMRHVAQEEQRARENYREFESQQAEQSRQARQAVSDLLYTVCEPERQAVESAMNDYETARENWQNAQDRLDEHTASRPSDPAKVREWSQEQAILDNEVSAFYDIASEKLAALEQSQAALARAKNDKLVLMRDAEYQRLTALQKEAKIEMSTLQAKLQAAANRWQAEIDASLNQLHLLGARMDSQGRLLETVPIVEK